MNIRYATAFLAASCLSAPAFGATHTVLADYSTGAGATPSGLPMPDGTGAYVGVARNGASVNPNGSIVRFTPPGTEGAPWTETVIYSFAGGSDGATPDGSLTADGSGGFLGATSGGGSAGAGTIFQLTPPGSPGSPWTHTVLYNFQGGSSDAAAPHGRLVSDGSGAFYGTSGGGGPSGAGAVFKLVPPGGPGAIGGWTESILAFFSGPPSDGRGPSNVALDPGGAIYVSLIAGGPSNAGEIVELTPPSSGTLWTKTVLHAFVSGHHSTDGKFPRDIYRDPSGTLFGMTAEGGTAKMGTLYSLTLAGSTWTETILHNFTGAPGDGGKPVGGLVADGSGGFAAVTKGGGSANEGAVVDLSPAGDVYGSAVLYSFLGHADGSAPDQGLQPDGSGDYYGVTLHGGTKNKGTFYSLTP